jgi:hypothetical protein
LAGAFVHHAEGHLLVRVVQKDGLQARELAALEVDLVVVEVEPEVGRVGFGTGAVVGEDPERAVGHLLDARVALDGLAFERQRHARGAARRQAFDRADVFDPLAGGELAAHPQIGRCVLGRGNEGLRGQHRVAREGGRVGGLGLGGNGRAGEGQREPCRGGNVHGGSDSSVGWNARLARRVVGSLPFPLDRRAKLS